MNTPANTTNTTQTMSTFSRPCLTNHYTTTHGNPPYFANAYVCIVTMCFPLVINCFITWDS